MTNIETSTIYVLVTNPVPKCISGWKSRNSLLKNYKIIILLGLFAWLCVCIAQGIYFGDLFAGPESLVLAPVFAPEDYFSRHFVAGDIIILSFLVILCGLPIFAWIKRSTPLAAVFCCLLLGASAYGWVCLQALVQDIGKTLGLTVSVGNYCDSFLEKNKRWPTNYDELVKFIGETNIQTLGHFDRVWFRELQDGTLEIYTVIDGETNMVSQGKPSINRIPQTETNRNQ